MLKKLVILESLWVEQAKVIPAIEPACAKATDGRPGSPYVVMELSLINVWRFLVGARNDVVNYVFIPTHKLSSRTKKLKLKKRDYPGEKISNE